MSKTVFKYQLRRSVGDSRVIVSMPEGAEVLAAAWQGVDACVWARVDPEQPRRDREFVVAGTGHALTRAGRYVGTVFVPGGLVFHVFEAA